MTKKANQFQLKISLKGSKPAIWRRVIVDSDLLLEDVHYLVQAVMPWCDCHMHQFIHNKTYYGPAEDVSDSFIDLIDYSEKKLSDLIASEKDTLLYEYDFGDSWEHTILLEKILPPTDSESRAEYVKGKNAAPPEDCGGIYGYAHLLNVLKDPKTADCSDMRDWMGLEDGEEFDPTDIGFDEDELNDELYGI